MEQQKQILYDFQFLSLEIGRSGFSTTTDLIVQSGQIPPYNPSMSNEQIATYVSDYIVKNWNQSDIQKAVNDAQNAIPVLRPKYDEKIEKQRIQYEMQREEEMRRKLQDERLQQTRQNLLQKVC